MEQTNNMVSEGTTAEDKKVWDTPAISRVEIRRTMATLGSGADTGGSALP
jgi:hypothetical protein